MRCEPAKYCLPDTVHTLVRDGCEHWVNWTGKAWKALGASYRDLSPEDAWKQGYRYSHSHYNVSMEVFI